MNLQALIDQLIAIRDSGPDVGPASLVIVEGWNDPDEADDLFQRDIESVMTEGRCEDEDELHAVYLRVSDEPTGT